MYVIITIFTLTYLCAENQLSNELPSSELNNSLQLIRLEINKVPRVFQGLVDPCSIEKASDGKNYAVLILDSTQVDSLRTRSVAFKSLGSLKEYVKKFLPLNTLRQTSIPSFEKYLDKEMRAAFRNARAEENLAKPCNNPTLVSLQPYDKYYNLDQGNCFLENLNVAYPEITDLVSIGKSVEGRDIWALKISDNPSWIEPEEEKILFTGIHHAREWITHSMMLYLAEYITNRYASDEEVKRIVDNSVIWLIPAVNPDGYTYSWTDDRLWRKNRRILNGGDCDGVDLNRNYDYRWAWDDIGSAADPCDETYRGDCAASEPETQAMQQLLAKENFSIVVNYHNYSQLVLYPWGHTGAILPESYSSLRAIGKKYADLVFNTHKQIYIPGEANYTLYPTNGDAEDYAYGVHGALSFTPELRPPSVDLGGFLLPEAEILATCEENLAAALWLMNNVANARELNTQADANPPSKEFGVYNFSLPETPINQKPEELFALSLGETREITTWLDDLFNNPPFWGKLGTDFEGIGTGNGYQIHVDSEEFIENLQYLHSYKYLPYVFEDGAEIMLSNVAANGKNYIGLPIRFPVDMQDVRIAQRIVKRSINRGEEFILNERSALEDFYADDPWIDWNWTYIDKHGALKVVNPEGSNGGGRILFPFLSYKIEVHVPSANFSGNVDPVLILRFPGAQKDCDYDTIPNAVEIAQGQSIDCNNNGLPDECEMDCNNNGIHDDCDLASGFSVDEDFDGIPDDCQVVLHVPSEYPTILAAIHAAKNLNRILVADGIYSGDGNRNINLQGKELQIISENGPANCIIDCGQQRGFEFINFEPSYTRLDGFTIINAVAFDGSAIKIKNSNPTITNCIIQQNFSGLLGRSHGIIYMENSSTTISNCIINDNEIAEYKEGAIKIINSNITIANCTIAKNFSHNLDFASLHISKSTVTLRNCILWIGLGLGHEITLQDNSTLYVEYSNIELGELGISLDASSFVNWSIGNLNIDPQFVDPTNLDYHLLDFSPCINAGDPIYLPEFLETDIDGDPRILGQIIDIGADEVTG